MVSTRGPKYKFSDGEKVLCFEPDTTKARVLYDSKVLEVIDGRDKRGRRVIEYLIHFQGWNSSWDRRVNEDFILKDTEENRQLQKDLADKSQLHQGAFLYRKERKKRKRKLSDRIIDGLLAEEGNSCSLTLGKDENYFNNTTDDLETEYYSSSVESNHDDDKVYLQVGDKLKRYLENDFQWICGQNRLTKLPAELPISTILENFVRHYAIKQLCGTQEQLKQRRRSIQTKSEPKTKDYEQIKSSIELSKEVADGLRLYFDFTVKDHLLYEHEFDEMVYFLSPEYLNGLSYIPTETFSLNMLMVKSDTTDNSDHSQDNLEVAGTSTKGKPRLRSQNKGEEEIILDFEAIKHESLTAVESGSTCVNSIASSLKILKATFPSNIGISTTMKEILNDAFSWKILPANATGTPSMVFGANHLARLIVRLPDFLSVSTMADDKIKLLLKFLDAFVEYLEDHEEWFGIEFYHDREPLQISANNEDLLIESYDIKKEIDMDEID